MKPRRKPHEPHWYRIFVGGCFLCGSDSGSRERVYVKDEPRPEDPRDRYVQLPDHACPDHFL